MKFSIIERLVILVIKKACPNLRYISYNQIMYQIESISDYCKHISNDIDEGHGDVIELEQLLYESEEDIKILKSNLKLFV